jgi:type II secretory ATPase GspE/PulE/Tfp pilus assembly ATPase PilB-like protein
VIRVLSNPRGLIWVTSSGAAIQGKNTEAGMMVSTLESPSNLITVADPPGAQILTLATTEEASDILTNCTI